MVWPDFGIGRDAERRVLGGELGQRDAELLLVGLRLRLDRDLDDRIGEFHLLEDHLLVQIAQRVAGAGVLEAGQRDDVAGEGLFDVLAVVGVHQQHAADALAPVLGRVDDRGAGLDLAGIDAAEGDRADERIVHDLEREHGERIGVVRHAHDFGAGVDVDALDAAAIDRRGQKVDDRVQQRLHALVLERRAAHDRHERDLPDRLADEALERVDVGLVAVEVGRHHVVVELDRRLDQNMAVFLGLGLEVGGNLFVVVLGAEALLFPHHRLHAQQVDDALEVRTRSRSAVADRPGGRRPWCESLRRSGRSRRRPCPSC